MHTDKTSHPVSAFRDLASEYVADSTSRIFVYEGLARGLGLRKVRRCLIEGVNLVAIAFRDSFCDRGCSRGRGTTRKGEVG